MTLRAQGCHLRASLAVDRPTYDAAVEATFLVTVECDEELTLAAGGNRDSKFGRDEDYDVTAVTTDSEIISEPGGETFGGAMGHVAFSRDAPLRARLVLSKYLVFPHGGRWEVVVRRHLMVGKKPNDEELVAIKVSAFIDVDGP